MAAAPGPRDVVESWEAPLGSPRCDMYSARCGAAGRSSRNGYGHRLYVAAMSCPSRTEYLGHAIVRTDGAVEVEFPRMRGVCVQS